MNARKITMPRMTFLRVDVEVAPYLALVNAPTGISSIARGSVILSEAKNLCS
jgi:hypothetical protein